MNLKKLLKMKKNWIKDAIKQPGALHKQLHISSNKPIPEKDLKKAEEKGGKIAKRARLAETLKHLNKQK